MTSFLRMLLVATALLSSGALQAAAAAGDDVCCAGEAEEKEPSCPNDCPPGVVCACCPGRGAVEAAVLDVAPATSPGVAFVVASAEPTLGASVTDIFQPPRV